MKDDIQTTNGCGKIHEIKYPGLVTFRNYVRAAEKKVFGKNRVPYKQNDKVYDYLLETSGDAIAKPFDALDKAVMSAFGVDWKNVEVYRHVVLEDFDYAECIIYTSKGKPTEGEDHEYAVEDVYPAD